MRIGNRCIYLLFAVMLTPFANAHEFWLESHGASTPGSTIAISARVGSEWPGEQSVRLPGMIDELTVFYGNEPTGDALQGRDNTRVFGHYKVKKDTTQTVILTTNNFSLTLPAEEFNDYLVEEGLDDALELRRQNQLMDSDSHEVFSRIAKFIVPVAGDKAHQKIFNLPLEISLISNPVAFDVKQPFSIKATDSGRPLAHVQIKAQLQNTQHPTLIAQTNEEGIATFILPQLGVWRFSVVSIQLINYGDIQWKSTWSSTTLTIN